MSYTISGPCAAEADLSDMSVEQKLAYANFCSVSFPCQAFRSKTVSRVVCNAGIEFVGTEQEHCPQDFQQNCPRSSPMKFADGCLPKQDMLMCIFSLAQFVA